nr:hypothetical protein Iba_chr11aCG1580 [Ipomoea batatas]
MLNDFLDLSSSTVLAMLAPVPSTFYMNTWFSIFFSGIVTLCLQPRALWTLLFDMAAWRNLTANGFGLVTGFRLPIASRKKLRCMKIDYKLELQCHGLSAMILDNKVESWCKMELGTPSMRFPVCQRDENFRWKFLLLINAAPECSRPATGDGRRSALDTHRITGKGMAPLTAPLVLFIAGSWIKGALSPTCMWMLWAVELVSLEDKSQNIFYP